VGLYYNAIDSINKNWKARWTVIRQKWVFVFQVLTIRSIYQAYIKRPFASRV